MGTGGGGGGKGGGGNPYAASNYQAGYGAFQPESGPPAIDPSHPEYEYFMQGWEAANSEYEQQMMLLEMLGGFGEEEGNDVDPLTETNTQYSEINELLGDIDTEAMPGGMYGYVDGKWQIIDRTNLPEDFQYGYSSLGNAYGTGIESRDSLYGQYLDAGSTATDYVNQQIESERANAALMGVAYEVTPEEKSRRINDYFATIWSGNDMTQLEDLFKEWGNPQGFEDWLYTRGESDESEDSAAAKSAKSTASPTADSSGKAGSTFLTDDDEVTLGKSSATLGG